MKLIGFFILIYGWFSLYDVGFNLEGFLCLIAGLGIVMFEEILAHIQWRRFHNDNK